jgi:predicted ATPase
MVRSTANGEMVEPSRGDEEILMDALTLNADPENENEDDDFVGEAADDVAPAPSFLQRRSQAEIHLQEAKVPVYKIVLTGGPCGGKTTSLARISSFLRERGFEVMTVPEAFSILVSNGMSMNYFATIQGFEPFVQGSVMDLQRNLEDGFENVLRSTGKPSVILCDRGLMDGAAYCSKEQWGAVLHQKNIKSNCDIREGRYNAVFHLVTAAEGAEQYYTLDNNVVRTETAEEARKLDAMTQAAWVGHPNLYAFDNSTNFEGKLQRIVDATAKLVGLPSTLQRVTTKYLLRSKPDIKLFPEAVHYRVFEVEKVYIYDDVSLDQSGVSPSPKIGGEGNETEQQQQLPKFTEEYSFIRKRRQGKGEVYGQTTVKRTADGQEIEVKRIISRREYTSLYKTRDMSRHVVRQTRASFIYKMQSFNVHIYEEPRKVKDLCILHCQFDARSATQVDDLKHAVALPPFLDVERQLEATPEDNAKFGAFRISVIGE